MFQKQICCLLKKRFIYLFIFREREREGEREGEKHQCFSLVAFRTFPTGDLACNPVTCPDWESNRWLFCTRASAQSTEPHQPGRRVFFFFLTTFLFAPLLVISQFPRLKTSGLFLIPVTLLCPTSSYLPNFVSSLLAVSFSSRCHHLPSLRRIVLLHIILLFKNFQWVTCVSRTKYRLLSLWL